LENLLQSDTLTPGGVDVSLFSVFQGHPMNSKQISVALTFSLFVLTTLVARPAAAQTTSQPEPKRITIYDDVRYRDGDSKSWTLDLAVPENFGDEKRPAFVIIHGGGWRAGTKRDRTFRAFLSEYALKGYVTMSVEYRLTGEAPLPACIEDVKCAIRWLRAHADQYKVDANRIAAYGHSAGAHLVLMLAMTPHLPELEGDGPWKDQSSNINAAIGGSTPTVLGQRFGDASGKWSPLTYVKKDLPPMLLIHGTGDTTVRVETADTFVEKLKETGYEGLTYVKIEGGRHSIAYEQEMDISTKAMNTFLLSALKLRMNGTVVTSAPAN
jgi:acetyl esterase/lipase